jgi:hypothetical protein
MPYLTIIQQGTSPKTIETSGSLRDALNGQGIDTDGNSILSGGSPVNLDSTPSSDMTVTVTKRSVGAA